MPLQSFQNEKNNVIEDVIQPPTKYEVMRALEVLQTCTFYNADNGDEVPGFSLGGWLMGRILNNRLLFENNKLLFLYCFLEILWGTRPWWRGTKSWWGDPPVPTPLGKTLGACQSKRIFEAIWHFNEQSLKHKRLYWTSLSIVDINYKVNINLKSVLTSVVVWNKFRFSFSITNHQQPMNSALKSFLPVESLKISPTVLLVCLKKTCI